MYIAFEGIVGSGKSTQAKKLADTFRNHPGFLWTPTLPVPDIISIREPGSTPIAEDIRYLAQGKTWESETMHPMTNAYLYAAARAQTLQTIVKPALERGDIVISDRSFLSSCTIQWEAQWLGIDTVLEINTPAISTVIPEKIIYLDIDVELALSRTFDHEGDKFEREGKDFYESIVRGYEKCMNYEIVNNRMIRIDANGSEEEVFERILVALRASIILI
jgi:dTMP kinase